MLLVTAEEMRAADRRAIEDYGIPSVVLMEHAGVAVATAAREMLPSGGRVLCVCGRGNNGGDGLVAARHLAAAGYGVTVALVAPESELAPDASTNLRPVRAMGLEVTGPVGDDDRVGSALSGADLIIDAVLGTGNRGPVRGRPRTAIEMILDSGRPVLSVDLPSGLDADTGQAELCPRARVTVTLGCNKRGLVLLPGAEYAGRVVVADIGLVPGTVRGSAILVDEDEARGWLPPRPRDAHKGTVGRVLIIAGSPGYTGAAILAARAALRSGAGLCYAAVPAVVNAVLESTVPEAITIPLAHDQRGMVGPLAVEAVIRAAEQCDVVAIGPGLGRDPQVERFILEVLSAVTGPVIIDADGLQSFEGCLDRLSGLDADTVITPHPGEMARLLGISTHEVTAEPVRVAQVAARASGGICVLKGPVTVIADETGFVALSNRGNPGMATAGMGDVLTGAIAGLAGQGIPLRRAAALGVYVHGRAGDLAADRGMRGLVAGDVCELLPSALAGIERA